MQRNLRSSIFLDPLRILPERCTLALGGGMEPIDRLDDHEAWIGEHNSSCVETIGSPAILANAARVTARHHKISGQRKAAIWK